MVAATGNQELSLWLQGGEEIMFEWLALTTA